MKTLRLLIVKLLTLASICHAQQDVVVTNAGWINMESFLSLAVTNPVEEGSQVVQMRVNVQPTTPPAPAVVAEYITPEIQALADGLQDNPLNIYNYVHDHIRFTLYFGSKKGAELTLLEKSGNDFDQCALLVALLRAAGYTNASYQFGWMMLPYDNPDGSHRDIHHWLGLSVTNSSGSWSTTSGFLDCIFRWWGNYPLTLSNFDQNTYAFQRVWVAVTVGGTQYLLDPAFKVSEPIPGINVQSAMAFSSNSLMTAAGGIDTANYVTNLNEANIRGTLAGYTTNVLNYIQSNYPNASVDQILSGQSIVRATNSVLSQMYFAPTNMYGTMPVLNWINEPTNLMSTFSVTLSRVEYQCFVPQLQGQRLSLTISSSGSAQLWLNDSNAATASTGGGSGNYFPTITCSHPRGTWNTNNNTFIPGTLQQSVSSQKYKAANASYAILYSFDPDWGWLQERQQQLEAYRQQGLSDTSRQVVTETLNVMGLNWLLQDEAVGQMLAKQIGVLPSVYHRIGRMSQESGAGYYVDVYMFTCAPFSTSNANDNHGARWTDLISYFGSAMEHGVIEQLQCSNLVGASTVKMLELANANHQAVYLATSTNWSSIKKSLVNYTDADVAGQLDSGWTLLLPQNGSIPVNGPGSWTGFGFLERNNNGTVSTIIGSGKYGGYASDLDASVDPGFIDYDSYSQPEFYEPAPVSVPNITAADPVNMADGTFQAQATDLSLGQTEPRGLSFSRYYSSSRRNSNLAGLAPGWLHNYYVNAAVISSPQASLGGTTAAQMAPMLAAIGAATGIYNGTQPDPKNWMVTALTAKWAIDQITAKAVSISMGKDTIQFIEQPNGTFSAPANCTMTLSQATTNSPYTLQERHGRTYQFNSAGWVTNIVDQYNQSLSLAYNSSNWVSTASDWKGRTLTFNYNATNPKHLNSVADNFGREVLFGYSGGNDLISVTDPENKSSTFLYDANHQIIVSSNALGQVVVSNVYNNFGRVTTQYTMGNTNKMWKIYWSGWRTVSQDPAGGQQCYFYDDKTRLIGQQDALGNLTQSIYDGQDHVITTVSPLNETNQFIYGGNNNLIQTIDPLGSSNTFVYDGLNNLVQAFDPVQNPTTYGYNSQFQLIGRTNGAGDWISFGYDTGDGVLLSRTDPAGTTSYGYDTTYRRLKSITYPNGLGGESFVNSPLGDVTNHTDARGFSTAFQYNQRRQLTNTIAPTNLVVGIAFDAVGNQSAVTDARKFTYTNTWTATRKLSSVAFPAVPQGAPVLTNIYDNRDWLVKTLDPCQQPTLYTNDGDNRLISSTDPVLRTRTFGYDGDSHQLFAANAGGETNSETWDARGKPVQLTDGAGHFSTRAYDAAGNQIFLTNRNTKVWQFQFDGANRVHTVTTPMSHQTVLTYNHLGLPNTITDPANLTTYLYYDARGRLTNRTDYVSTYYGYDANGNGTNVVENNATNTWTYDAYNRVSSYTDIDGYLIQYRYDANGNLTNLIYPGRKTVVYFYDSLNRLTNVTDWAGRETSIGYDLDSRVTSITRPNGSYRAISFDAAGQATNILEGMANRLPIAIFRYGWTNTGTMGWEFTAPLPHGTTFPTRAMTYDNDNRLSTFQGPSMGSPTNVGVSADGNITSAPLTNDLFVTYTFDPRNRLANAGGVTNRYDALNHRVVEFYGATTNVFVVNPNGQLPQVLMRMENGATNYYVYGPGLLYQVTETPSGENVLVYHFDYRGSTVALSDGTGRVTDRVEYSAYGSITYRVGTNDTPFLFNGRFGVMTDANGLLYMGARHYNPYLCRFVSADPSGFHGGLNLYAYADGNPVSYVDPFGMGAMESSVDRSWFNAPTPEQQEAQAQLASFVNFVTLGVANLVSSATTGRDLTGNNLNVADAYQDTLESGVFVALQALSLPMDGAALEEEVALDAETDAADTTTVGRWMSQDEFEAMQSSQTVQAPLNGAGATHVTVPPNPAAFTPQPSSGSVFVQFDVPTSQLRINDPGQGWGRVFGPDSIEARLAARQGLPVPTQMPPAFNIQQTASQWPR